MGESSEKANGTVQYWLEVHRIGSLLFEDTNSSDKALKSLITSIIETPLLSDIECLTGEARNERKVAPFTSWLLQGLLKAATCSQQASQKTFYIDAQSKLLLSAYNSSVHVFKQLIVPYIEALESVMKMTTFNTEFKFLFSNDYVIEKYEKSLKSLSFKVVNKKGQSNFALVLIQVVISMKHLVLHHCSDIYSKLWNISTALINSKHWELKFTVLPLLTDMLKSLPIECDVLVWKDVFRSISTMLLNPVIKKKTIWTDDLVQCWTLLRTSTKSLLCDEDIVKNILQARDSSPVSNFILEESSIYLSQIGGFNLVLQFLNKFEDMHLHDKVRLLLDCVVNELEIAIEQTDNRTHKHGSLEAPLVIYVKDVSQTWTYILSLYNSQLENPDPVLSKYRSESFHWLVNVCCKILGKLESNITLSRYNIEINFFGVCLCQFINKILQDLNSVTCQYDQALEKTIKTISELLNLPEMRNLSANGCKEVVDFLLSPFKPDGFQLAGLSNSANLKDSPIPGLFLISLQSLPPGLQVDRCISIFSKCASNHENDLPLAIQAVKSVPHIFLTRKTSPSRLISEILLPGALSNVVSLQITVIEALVDLVCALAGTGVVVRNETGELLIECCECSGDCQSLGTTGDVNLVEPHLIKLISQIKLKDSVGKKALLGALLQLSMHISGLKNKSILSYFLRFLSDEDELIRRQFANCVTSLIFGRYWVTRSLSTTINEDAVLYSSEGSYLKIIEAFELTLSKLERLIHLSLSSKEQAHFQFSLIETLTSIACFPVATVLPKCIKLLLLFIGQPNSRVSAIFLQIASSHRTTPLALYHSYRPEISLFLGNLVVANRLRYNQPLRVTLSEVASVFKGLPEASLASLSESRFIPVLLSWIDRWNGVEDLLCDWCEYVQRTVLNVLTRSFPNLYSYVLLTQTKETFDKCMKFVEKVTNVKISELILHSQKLTINQLLFNYHCAPDKVLWGLRNVLDSFNQEMSRSQIAEDLDSRFVGYLLFIVAKFVKDFNADSEKVQAILSLTSVIELMGSKHITPVARKVLATLQTTLTFKKREYFDIQCKAWEQFIRTVDMKELAPLLATIVTSLLPFLEFLPDRVSGIFNYLIVQNERSVKAFLPGVIFMPDHESLRQVNRTLKKHLTFDEEELRDQLLRETKLALHETVGVRVEGLKALQATIKSSSLEIQNLIIGSDEPDPCIRTLLDGLISCCCDLDQNVSQQAACCLGRLGAVDPGLLPRKVKPKNELPLSVHVPEFAYLALTEIARGFQNARNSVDMDAFAVAMQELLRTYQINPNEEIWKRFPKETQCLMTPMLTSRYKVQAPKREGWPDLIFGSKEGNTHVDWASLWASKLIGYCRDDRAACLFKVCELSLKRDTKVLLFFLQYILLHAVIRDSSVHDAIIEEINAVINWSPSGVERDDFRTKSRPIRLVDYCGYPNMRSTIGSTDAQACAVTIFLLLDFLHAWLRLYRAGNASPNGEHLQKRDYILVRDFLKKIDFLKVASYNYEIREYSRAIMYLEDVITEAPDTLSEHLPLLSKAYMRFGDLDSVAGASTFQKTAPKIEDLLLNYQVSGRMEEVRIIYERLGKDGLMTPSHMQEMIQCYLNLGEPFSAYNLLESVTTKQPDLFSILSDSMAESLIKLGDYNQLNTFLQREEIPCQTGWFVQIGKLVLDLRNNLEDNGDFLESITSIRRDVAAALKQTGIQFGDQQQSYSCLVKLQLLNELECVYETVRACQGSSASNCQPILEQLTEGWTLMSAIVQSNPITLEPLMSTRRILLNVLKDKLPRGAALLDREVGKYWVKSAEIARKAGCFHQAYNFILNAEQYNIPSTFIEKAQLYWDKGDQDLCLFTLSRGIKEYFPDVNQIKNSRLEEKLEERKQCAEAKLLYAIYSEETSNCDYLTNIANYQEAFDVCRSLEKSEALLAQCFDRVVAHLDSTNQDLGRACEYRVHMVHYFGKSLMNGCEYIYQTVPRMLSIWLDLGENVNSPEKANAMSKINKLIQHFVEKLPPFILMTALPQLLSRLGHANLEVLAILKHILVTLTKAFPQQCLWAFQAVAKSSVQQRVRRYSELIQDNALRTPTLHRLIKDFTSLCDMLNRLTNRNMPQDAAYRGFKVSSLVRELPNLLASEKFSAIIIPITRFCSISIPRNVKSASHEPFPKQAVYITGIEDEMTVLPSLQRPRKISFRGSDGNVYDILCKPKDDLRRDGRLMEFNNIVNMYLHRDADSRARGLHIRTYAVTPLGENGGLLEWVPNLVGLRPALLKIYKQFGKYRNMKEVKKHEIQLRDSLEKKRTTFTEKLVPLHPPLLPEWFRQTFPDPSGWFIARQSYIRTTAVMSMVGYILGLGDRHGENILFDSETGDIVHVDFNCLFNKGEKLDWKERVPFRLTHNMVAAMGPFGVEGTFRKSCEISLRVLRSQVKTLMSVLTPFAYDPSGSWGKNKEIISNERDKKMGEAIEELSDIEKRLNGSLRVRQKNSTLYLSVEGQVRSLIVEATDVDNLCQMYIGWGAYL